MAWLDTALNCHPATAVVYDDSRMTAAMAVRDGDDRINRRLVQPLGRGRSGSTVHPSPFCRRGRRRMTKPAASSSANAIPTSVDSAPKRLTATSVTYPPTIHPAVAPL